MIMLLLALALATPAATLNQSPMPNKAPETRLAVLCFKSGERTSGFNKIGYYNCMGSTAAITIGAVQLCPLNINR